MATLETYTPGRLYDFALARLQPDPNQPRKHLDAQALDELTASVAQHGILEPVLIRQDKATGLFYVVAGERRCAAARKAGLESVPTVFLDGDNYDEIALVENLLRQDLTPVEEAEALQRLQADHAYQQADLARIIAKSAVNISETLSLNRLPQEIRDECRGDASVPKAFLITLARNKQQRRMISQYKKFRQAQAADGATQTAARRSPAEALLNTLAMIGKKVQTLKPDALTEAERTRVKEALENLKGLIEEALAGITPTRSPLKRKKS